MFKVHISKTSNRFQSFQFSKNKKIRTTVTSSFFVANNSNQKFGKRVIFFFHFWCMRSWSFIVAKTWKYKYCTFEIYMSSKLRLTLAWTPSPIGNQSYFKSYPLMHRSWPLYPSPALHTLGKMQELESQVSRSILHLCGSSYLDFTLFLKCFPPKFIVKQVYCNKLALKICLFRIQLCFA